ncbi:magnesium/cobalt transporter CorA [Reichenbachiella versicolor]|uniref:magnesium/cobalt transporter CorA n=1 Tax=Reichenbachiella versicolor TaxID=1821036 RepID=UPI000D6DEEE3|nr:magnesium/cobalt transporter CorA [Reichenbachiella versicolor]
MITLTQYDSKEYSFQDHISPDEIKDLTQNPQVSWVDIEGFDNEVVKALTENYGIHPLILEDILSVEQLPKFELFKNYVFFSANMLTQADEGKIVEEKISIVLGEHVLITFQEGLPGDVFDELRNRIRYARGLIRGNAVDYLFYQILNAVISNYTRICEKLRSTIDDMEDRLLQNTSFDVMKEVISVKRDVNLIRRITIPLWEAINTMKAEGKQFLPAKNQPYLHDLEDSVKYILSFCDTSRDMLRDLMDMHNTNQNNEMNQIMKALTILSAIFIPVTFIAGVYGMNFDEMPELHWRYGYFTILATMSVTAIAIYAVLKKKGWM